MTIPARRVMNWIEHGVEDGPDVPLSKCCEVRVMEVNVDRKYLSGGDYSTAMETCKREPCVCRQP